MCIRSIINGTILSHHYRRLHVCVDRPHKAWPGVALHILQYFLLYSTLWAIQVSPSNAIYRAGVCNVIDFKNTFIGYEYI